MKPRVNIRCRIKYGAPILALIVFFTTGHSQNQDAPPLLYSVQLGAFGTDGEAQQAKQRYQDQGYSPVAVVNRGGGYGYKVLAGQFGNYMDAYIWKSAIRDAGGDAFVVTDPNTSGNAQFGPNRSPLPGLFNFRSGIRDNPSLSLSETPQMGEVIQLIRDGNLDTAELRLSQMMSGLESGDVEQGWCIQKLASIRRKTGKLDEAVELYKKVAEGSVGSPRSTRMECTLSVGSMYHAKGMRVKAYQAFSEMLPFFDDDESRCKALVGLAGLSMELARSGKGTADDCRRLCGAVLACSSSTTATLQAKATASLMRLETYYLMDTDMKTVVSLADKHLADFPAVPREREWALFFKGQALFELGAFSEAAATYSTILKDNLVVDNQFAGLDAKSFARYKLATCYYEMHQPDEAMTQLEWLLQNPSKTDANVNKAVGTMYDWISQEQSARGN